MDPAKIDPALRRALDEAAENDDASVEAVVVLNPSDPSAVVDTPDETVRKGHAVVERVSEAIGQAPAEVNVFENLQSMAVRARAKFIEALLEQPEIGSAMANRSTSPTSPPEAPARSRPKHPRR